MDIIYFCYLLRLHFFLCVQSRGLPRNVDQFAHNALNFSDSPSPNFDFSIREAIKKRPKKYFNLGGGV